MSCPAFAPPFRSASTWTEHEISGPDGIKFDDSQLIDLDGDCDLDIINTEEDFGPGFQGLGVIWYENPQADSAEGCAITVPAASGWVRALVSLLLVGLGAALLAQRLHLPLRSRS